MRTYQLQHLKQFNRFTACFTDLSKIQSHCNSKATSTDQDQDQFSDQERNHNMQGHAFSGTKNTINEKQFVLSSIHSYD